MPVQDVLQELEDELVARVLVQFAQVVHQSRAELRRERVGEVEQGQWSLALRVLVQ